jgi:autotransporter-associated beta strand protein
MKQANWMKGLALALSAAWLTVTLPASAETSTWAGASGANWDTPASWTGVNTPPLATDDALFNLSTRTVAITTTPGISNITVSGSGAWTWSGVGMLTLNGLFSYGSSGSSTFSAALTGPGSLSVDAGTLTLSGTNTFTGTITVQAGKTLIVSGGYNETPSVSTLKSGAMLLGPTSLVLMAGPLTMENDSRIYKSHNGWNRGPQLTNTVTMAGDKIYLGLAGNTQRGAVSFIHSDIYNAA